MHHGVAVLCASRHPGYTLPYATAPATAKNTFDKRESQQRHGNMPLDAVARTEVDCCDEYMEENILGWDHRHTHPAVLGGDNTEEDKEMGKREEEVKKEANKEEKRGQNMNDEEGTCVGGKGRLEKGGSEVGACVVALTERVNEFQLGAGGEEADKRAAAAGGEGEEREICRDAQGEQQQLHHTPEAATDRDPNPQPSPRSASSWAAVPFVAASPSSSLPSSLPPSFSAIERSDTSGQRTGQYAAGAIGPILQVAPFFLPASLSVASCLPGLPASLLPSLPAFYICRISVVQPSTDPPLSLFIVLPRSIIPSPFLCPF